MFFCFRSVLYKKFYYSNETPPFFSVHYLVDEFLENVDASINQNSNEMFQLLKLILRIIILKNGFFKIKTIY